MVKQLFVDKRTFLRVIAVIDDVLPREVQQVFIQFIALVIEPGDLFQPEDIAFCLLFQYIKNPTWDEWHNYVVITHFNDFREKLCDIHCMTWQFSDDLQATDSQLSHLLSTSMKDSHAKSPFFFLYLTSFTCLLNNPKEDYDKALQFSNGKRSQVGYKACLLYNCRKEIIWTSYFHPASIKEPEIMRIKNPATDITYYDEITQNYGPEIASAIAHKGIVKLDKSEISEAERVYNGTDNFLNKFSIFKAYRWRIVLDACYPIFRVCCKLHNLCQRDPEDVQSLLDGAMLNEALWDWNFDKRLTRGRSKPTPQTRAVKKPETNCGAGKLEERQSPHLPPIKTIVKPKLEKATKNRSNVVIDLCADEEDSHISPVREVQESQQSQVLVKCKNEPVDEQMKTSTGTLGQPIQLDIKSPERNTQAHSSGNQELQIISCQRTVDGLIQYLVSLDGHQEWKSEEILGLHHGVLCTKIQ
uniref:Uncharacterized protein n=1 Tax=Vannella robusta TaxID=1487602 RepID=A0A7S4HTZ6_9EUKA|mmetsp:Transcript_1574/g.1996  ORF Transcript_1574/g.1996 Transcript_1574/m.1996 type:complete len:471 (+) Transcript_1574:137-1549(+)